MKTILTAQQLLYFREHGRISFENFPFDPPFKADFLPQRDLWRLHPSLKHFLLHKLAPLTLELTGKRVLRLACDQWKIPSHPSLSIASFFGFQNLACACAWSFETKRIEILDPSHLISLLLPDSYLVLFALKSGRYIQNNRDPENHFLKQWGYAFGDVLNQHPLIYATS